jgi:hypothetical protein
MSSSRVSRPPGHTSPACPFILHPSSHHSAEHVSSHMQGVTIKNAGTVGQRMAGTLADLSLSHLKRSALIRAKFP